MPCICVVQSLVNWNLNYIGKYPTQIRTREHDLPGGTYEFCSCILKSVHASWNSLRLALGKDRRCLLSWRYPKEVISEVHILYSSQRGGTSMSWMWPIAFDVSECFYPWPYSCLNTYPVRCREYWILDCFDTIHPRSVIQNSQVSAQRPLVFLFIVESRRTGQRRTTHRQGSQVMLCCLLFERKGLPAYNS